MGIIVSETVSSIFREIENHGINSTIHLSIDAHRKLANYLKRVNEDSIPETNLLYLDKHPIVIEKDLLADNFWIE